MSGGDAELQRDMEIEQIAFFESPETMQEKLRLYRKIREIDSELRVTLCDAYRLLPGALETVGKNRCRCIHCQAVAQQGYPIPHAGNCPVRRILKRYNAKFCIKDE